MAEPLRDDQAPVLGPAALRSGGGTGLLSDQSTCPFRAFARHRLDAAEHRLPRPGLNPAQRGTLIHDALEFFWQDVTGGEALRQLAAATLQQRIDDAVDAALDKIARTYRLVLSRRSRLLERARCQRWLLQWLQLEANRPDFTVVEREAEITIVLGELTLSGKLDRVDALADGQRLLIDYKTKASGLSSNRWAPDQRMVDPQLPAYALSMKPAPGAITFANIAPQAAKFSGVSREPTGIAGVTEIGKARHGFSAIDHWEPLLEQWRADLTQLATSYRDGAAAVDPSGKDSCKYCHLKSLCRINERSLNMLYGDDTEDGPDHE